MRQLHPMVKGQALCRPGARWGWRRSLNVVRVVPLNLHIEYRNDAAPSLVCEIGGGVLGFNGMQSITGAGVVLGDGAIAHADVFHYGGGPPPGSFPPSTHGVIYPRQLGVVNGAPYVSVKDYTLALSMGGADMAYWGANGLLTGSPPLSPVFWTLEFDPSGTHPALNFPFTVLEWVTVPSH